VKIWQALIFLLFGSMITALLPDHAIDPWGIFNPHKYSLLVVTLATLEFTSFSIAKLFGAKRGVYLVGFLGGLVSSTAMLLTSAKQAKKAPSTWRTQLIIALTANLAALLELLFIVGFIAPELLKHLSWVVCSALAVGLIELYFINKQKLIEKSDVILKEPLDLKGVFRLSLLLGGILISISVAKKWFGNSGSFAVSFLTGLFELHGVTLANATMFQEKQITEQAVILSIALAAQSSFIAKISLAWIWERGPFARGLTFTLLPIMIVVGIVTWLVLSINF
jgi:uncharacterized membrane protein (DUF4010 family)